MRSRPSRTAEWVAFIRALETQRPPKGRVVHDPWAQHFLSPPLRLALAADTAPQRAIRDAVGLGLSACIVARHRFIDDVLDAVLGAGAVDHVVVLGAGYDARAWRFADALVDVSVYEVDHPATGSRKARIAMRLPTPQVALERISVDFRTQDLRQRLVGAGFRPGRRTLWIWEGVSMYLERAAIEHTLTTLSSLSAPGSRLAMDWMHWPDDGNWRGRWWHRAAVALRVIGEPIVFTPFPAQIDALLRPTGWRAHDLADPGELQRRYLNPERAFMPSVYTVEATMLPRG